MNPDHSAPQDPISAHSPALLLSEFHPVDAHLKPSSLATQPHEVIELAAIGGKSIMEAAADPSNMAIDPQARKSPIIPTADPSGPSSSLAPIDEHVLTLEQVCQKYGTRVNFENTLRSEGLCSRQVGEYHKLYGTNALSPPKKPNPFVQYLKYLRNVFNLLLIVASILSFVLYAIDTSTMTNLYLALILIAVTLFNAGLEFYQEFKTAALLESFLTLIPANTVVIRDGSTQPLPAADLVPGDLVNFKTGDKIPADLRLVRAIDLKVDNSSLTGESEPQERSLCTGSRNPLEATNLVFNGTLVVSGDGQGIVVRTGNATLLGQIAGMTINEKKRDSQLSREIDFFVKKLSAVAVATAIVFFIIGFIKGYTVALNFSFIIGVFVSFVPQGLPVTVTALLTIAAKRMSQLNVLVKDLHGVETLGSITMLATDKTGTLTQNKMSVTGVWMNATVYDHHDAQDGGLPTAEPRRLRGTPLTPQTPNIETLLFTCGLCTKCRVDADELAKPVEERTIFGDATEVGLFRFAMASYDVIQMADRHKKVCEIPFSSNTKWHLTIHEMEHREGHYVIYLKGAPERVAKRCSLVLDNELVQPWTESTTSAFGHAYESFAAQGQRVLAFAQILLPGAQFPKGYQFKKEDPPNFPTESGFTFVGLVSLMDPPKRGVRKAVAAFRTAGIQVVMVTGDHPLTAEAIARKIGLIQGETAAEAALRLQRPIQSITEDEYDAVIIHGDKIDGMTDDEWDRVLSKREIVFARTSPRHKLMIVTRSQAKGHIVGVSGDGVNDSPALKKADLGISMNLTGSDVSKEAAAMILLDDHFPSIVNGIAQGRLLFANLKKSIRYTLTHIMPEVLAFLTYILFAIPLPLSSMLIIFIDLVNEIAPSLSFAWEVPDSDLMLVPPRKVLCTEAKNYATFEQEVELPLQRTLTPLPPPSTSPAALGPLPRMPTLAARTSSIHTLTSAQRLSESGIAARYARFIAMLKRNFFRNETGEVLVDNDLLIWSYLEGGIILAIGCFGAYLMQFFIDNVPLNLLYNNSLTFFVPGAPPILLTNGQIADATQQLAFLASAQSAYYAAIVIGQMFTLFMVKHRYSYPYGWDLFKNTRSLIAICITAAVGAIIIYVPAFNSFIPSGPVGILALLMPLAAGTLMIIYEFIRKFLRFRGYFGGVPQKNANLLELVRTTTTMTAQN